MNHSPRKVDRPWYGLARLLPRRTRRRVFDPFYYDLLSERSHTSTPLMISVAGAVVGAFGVATLSGLARMGRRLQVGIALAVAAIVVALAGQAYSTSGNDSATDTRYEASVTDPD